MYSEVYQDLDPRALYTSCEDLSRICSHPLIRGTWVDLGAGEGESLLHYTKMHEHEKAIGIELALDRIEEFKKKKKSALASLIHGDLFTCEIPDGDIYFLYFPTGPVLDRILTELSKREKSFTIVAIESHGDLLARLDLENWIERIDEIPLSSMRHYQNAVLYKSLPVERDLSQLEPWTLSYQGFHLEVNQDGKRWLGESLGMTHLEGMQFNLLHPPRTIQWKDVKVIHAESDLGPLLRMLIELRRSGEVDILTVNRSYVALIRKIILWPVFSLELSSGETIEWSGIKAIQKGLFTCYESSSSSFSFLPAVSERSQKVEEKLTLTYRTKTTQLNS